MYNNGGKSIISQTFYFIIILKIAVTWLVLNKRLLIIWLFSPSQILGNTLTTSSRSEKEPSCENFPHFIPSKFSTSFLVEKVFFLLLKLIAPAALIHIPFVSFKDVIASLFLFQIFKRSSICFPLHILLYSMQTVLSNQNHFLDLLNPKDIFRSDSVWNLTCVDFFCLSWNLLSFPIFFYDYFCLCLFPRCLGDKLYTVAFIRSSSF